MVHNFVEKISFFMFFYLTGFYLAEPDGEVQNFPFEDWH